MTPQQRLDKLCEGVTHTEKKWIHGYIPNHYHRITIDKKEQLRLAKLGASEIGAYFNTPLYYTQSIICGAALSGDYDKITVCTPSQYGKTWTLGKLALLLAYYNNPVLIASVQGSISNLIMEATFQAINIADMSIKKVCSKNALTMAEKLDYSMSKKGISLPGRGKITPITLGDVYGGGLAHNQALGRGGLVIEDEAALISPETQRELARGQLSRDDNKSFPMIKISNPHCPGPFYDDLINPNPTERELIIWMDAKTAIQEGRWTYDKIKKEDYYKDRNTCTRYWLCELPKESDGFLDPIPNTNTTVTTDDITAYFVGVDPAYKGKDKTVVCLLGTTANGNLKAVKFFELGKKWVAGLTSRQIIKKVVDIFDTYNVVYGCSDIGQGIWFHEMATQHNLPIERIFFGQAPTKDRVKAKDPGAVQAVNKRSEMYLDLANILENKRLYINKEDYENYIEPVLPFITRISRAQDKYLIKSKEEIKAELGYSPDHLDALVLAIHAVILYSRNYVGFIY